MMRPGARAPSSSCPHPSSSRQQQQPRRPGQTPSPALQPEAHGRQAPLSPASPGTHARHRPGMGLFSTLLPSRNALFELRLEIKDLANVPLVAGAFGTEWRFRKTSKGAADKIKQAAASKSGGGRHRDGEDGAWVMLLSHSPARARATCGPGAFADAPLSRSGRQAPIRTAGAGPCRRCIRRCRGRRRACRGRRRRPRSRPHRPRRRTTRRRRRLRNRPAGHPPRRRHRTSTANRTGRTSSGSRRAPRRRARARARRPSSTSATTPAGGTRRSSRTSGCRS